MLVNVFLNWFFTLLIFPLTLFLLIQNFGLEFVKRYYVKLALEFVFTGMLPLLIASLRREDWEDYGFTWVNWKRSVAYGLVLASPFMLIRVYALLFLGYEGWSWSLNPLMFLAFLPVYGPLEAFFIVFSIVKIDKAFLMQGLMSKGLLLNSLFFGLMHTANYFFHPDVTLILINYVLLNVTPALFVGPAFKKSNSTIGSSLFGTLLNFF